MAAGFHRMDLPYRARRNAQNTQQNNQQQNNQQQNNQQQNNQPHLNHQQQAEIREAILSRGPRTLWNLWLEYEEGLDNHKPAKNFTASERGQVKSVYSHRNHFWRAMEKIISRGHSALAAIEMLQTAYGEQLSVSNMCRACKNDKDLTQVQLNPQNQQQMG